MSALPAEVQLVLALVRAVGMCAQAAAYLRGAVRWRGVLADVLLGGQDCIGRVVRARPRRRAAKVAQHPRAVAVQQDVFRLEVPAAAQAAAPAHRRAVLTVPAPEGHTRAHRCARGGLWWCMTAIALATEWKTVNTSPSLSWPPRSSI